MGFRERILNVQLSEENHDPEDAVALGTRIVAVTVECHPASGNTVLFGWNEKASTKNELNLGDSKPFRAQPGDILDGNSLYVDFGSGGSNGIAVITVMVQDKEDC